MEPSDLNQNNSSKESWFVLHRSVTVPCTVTLLFCQWNETLENVSIQRWTEHLSKDHNLLFSPTKYSVHVRVLPAYIFTFVQGLGTHVPLKLPWPESGWFFLISFFLQLHPYNLEIRMMFIERLLTNIFLLKISYHTPASLQSFFYQELVSYRY